MVPKNQLRAAGEFRKMANGHCTATKGIRKTNVDARDCLHLPQFSVRCHSRSSAMAGTISNSGNSGGVNWVTGQRTGPSFGSAGNSGRIQLISRTKTEYTPATAV